MKWFSELAAYKQYMGMFAGGFLGRCVIDPFLANQSIDARDVRSAVAYGLLATGLFHLAPPIKPLDETK